MPAIPGIPKVRSMNFERRSETRQRVELPVSLPGGGTGITRDVSANGLFIEFDGRLEAGDAIELSVALPDEARPLRLQARGVVVRVASEGERKRCGVGVRVVSSTLNVVQV
jgi:hypothetical protein